MNPSTVTTRADWRQIRQGLLGNQGFLPLAKFSAALIAAGLVLSLILGAIAEKMTGTAAGIVQVAGIGSGLFPFWVLGNGLLQMLRIRALSENGAKNARAAQLVLGALFLFTATLKAGSQAGLFGYLAVGGAGAIALLIFHDRFKKAGTHQLSVGAPAAAVNPSWTPEEQPGRTVRNEPLQAQAPNPEPNNSQKLEKRQLEPEPEPEALDDLLEELGSHIGLETAKQQVRDLVSFVQVQKMRAEHGLETKAYSPNLRLEGPPGTGKTTIARILARIYFSLGLTKSGRLVEASRADFIGQHQGHSTEKTNKLIDSALDAVLFTDEAYNLSDGEYDNFGKEAQTVLLTRMENEADRLTVFVAGYEKEMARWIASNPGLSSRFNRRIIFDPYSAEDLTKIATKMVGDANYSLNFEAEELLATHMVKLVEELGAKEDFGNGREARNYRDNLLLAHSRRTAGQLDVTRHDLETLTTEDLNAALELTLGSRA